MMCDNPPKDFIGKTESESESEPGCESIKRRRDPTVVTANADSDQSHGNHKAGRERILL